MEQLRSRSAAAWARQCLRTSSVDARTPCLLASATAVEIELEMQLSVPAPPRPASGTATEGLLSPSTTSLELVFRPEG